MDDQTDPSTSVERHPDDLAPDPDQPRGFPRGLLWAASLFVVVLAIASFVALSADGSKNASPGDVVHLDPSAAATPDVGGSGGLSGVDIVGLPAPAATFETFAGPQASMTDFVGRPVVLNFWSSTCAPCIAEMPAYEKVHQQYGDKVVFVGIDTVDGQTPARALAAKTGVTYHLGFDPTGAIAKSYGVTNLPTTVLIGRDGKVMHTEFGDHSNELAKNVDQYLKP